MLHPCRPDLQLLSTHSTGQCLRHVSVCENNVTQLVSSSTSLWLQKPQAEVTSARRVCARQLQWRDPSHNLNFPRYNYNLEILKQFTFDFTKSWLITFHLQRVEVVLIGHESQKLGQNLQAHRFLCFFRHFRSRHFVLEFATQTTNHAALQQDLILSSRQFYDHDKREAALLQFKWLPPMPATLDAVQR